MERDSVVEGWLDFITAELHLVNACSVIQTEAICILAVQMFE